jgi:hypothetical protein
VWVLLYQGGAGQNMYKATMGLAVILAIYMFFNDA